MDGNVCTQNGVIFVCLILTISVVSSGGSSDGFRQDMNQTKSLEYNVTQAVGTNVVIECRSESMNSTDQPSWFKYDHGKIDIYNASSSTNSNSSKYLVRNGNKTLTVMNVQLSDAVTYCCNVGDLYDYCSNVVIIGSLEASSRVDIGDTVNLTCSVNYNSPTKDLGAPFPLSDDQAPKLSMLLGDVEIAVQQIVDADAMPYTKTISVNKTVVVENLERYLECELSSTEPSWYRIAFARIARIDVSIIYPNNALSSNGEYKVNDVFECVAERFPFLNATWTDVTTSGTPRIISTGIGNTTAKVLAAGIYAWMCSTTSPLKRNMVSTYLVFTARNLSDSDGNKGSSAGEKVTRPILLTAGCMLFTALVVF